MPPRKKTAAGPIPVEDIRHDDKRANIPTGQDREDLAVPLHALGSTPFAPAGVNMGPA